MRTFCVLVLTLFSSVSSFDVTRIPREKRRLFDPIPDSSGSDLHNRASDFFSTTSSQPSSSAKPVIAHVIVGNTFPYTIDNWTNDIALASAHGIDGFALNIGNDEWHSSKVADAYRAALGTEFKLFISFDMNVIPCNSTSDEQGIRKYITDYHDHPNQLLFNGGALVSTFGGDKCQFGADSVNNGWMETLKSQDMPSVWFVPSFFVEPATFPSLSVMNGYFGWNAGWPIDGSNITFDADQAAISHLDGRSYMAPCSPWFFTHYGPDTFNKNFMYRGDDWLFVERWELLVNNRDRVDAVEVLTWNDYGESHYVGPIEGAQPMSESWVNGFDHQAWLELENYYISAFKYGAYPSVTEDKIFLWARLYPADAVVPQDAVGKPDRSQFTQDYLWGVVFSTGGAASVILSCGNYSETTQISGPGAFKVKMYFDSAIGGGQVSAVLKRNGASIIDFVPSGFMFDTNPKMYNFNAFVAGSESSGLISLGFALAPIPAALFLLAGECVVLIALGVL